MIREKIIVISQLPPPVHGSTVMTSRFLDAASEMGANWQLVDRRFSSSIEEVGLFSVRKVLYGLHLIWRLFLALLSKRPKCVVLFLTNRPASFLVDVALAQLTSNFRVPLISYIHTSGYAELAERGRGWSRLVRMTLRRSSTIVSLSPLLSDELSRLVGRDDLVEIPNCLSPSDASSAQKPGPIRDEGLVHIGFLSNLLSEKGADLFVESAIKIATRFPNVEFSLAGASVNHNVTEELISRVESSGLAKRIRFEGSVLGEQKWTYLRHLDIFVFPSRYRYEAQPLVLLEAMALALPVIASDVGGVSDLVVHGETGVLVERDSVDGIVSALERLLHSPDLRRALGRAARSRYEREFSFETYVANWAEVLAPYQLRRVTD